MAADEPTKAPASQEEKAGSGGAKKRRRRRRPRRKSGTSGGGAATQGQAKKTGGQASGGKATSTGGRSASSKGGGTRAGRRRSGTKQRGGTPHAAKTTGGARGTKSGDTKRSARRQKIPTTREVSAGGVVYRKTDNDLEVVLASRRTRRGQLAWGLAKGGIEEGETKEDAAIREVREETGMTAVIEADLGDTKYMYVWDDIRIRKTVHFFLMRHTGGNVDDRDDEMEEIRWFPMERAIKRAAYRGERDMLVKASELLR